MQFFVRLFTQIPETDDQGRERMRGFYRTLSCVNYTEAEQIRRLLAGNITSTGPGVEVCFKIGIDSQYLPIHAINHVLRDLQETAAQINHPTPKAKSAQYTKDAATEVLRILDEGDAKAAASVMTNRAVEAERGEFDPPLFPVHYRAWDFKRRRDWWIENFGIVPNDLPGHVIKMNDRNYEKWLKNGTWVALFVRKNSPDYKPPTGVHKLEM